MAGKMKEKQNENGAQQCENGEIAHAIAPFYTTGEVV